MEVKVYFNKKFPTSLIDTEVNITRDLDYVGSVIVEHTGKTTIEATNESLQYVFDLCQLDANNLQIKLTRSLSVGDVLSIRYSEDECTRFWLINHVGFTKL